MTNMMCLCVSFKTDCDYLLCSFIRADDILCLTIVKLLLFMTDIELSAHIILLLPRYTILIQMK